MNNTKRNERGQFIYDYENAASRTGWRSWCKRSPLDAPPTYPWTTEDAKKDGFAPTRRSDLEEYIIVNTCWSPGFTHKAAKEYYSLWGRGWHTAAKKRVINSPNLERHQSTILYDWPEGDKHWQWVATAKISEIRDWAIVVESAGTVGH